MDSDKRYQKLSKIIKKTQLKLERNYNWRLIWGLLLILGLFLAAFFPAWHIGLPSLILFGVPFFYCLTKTKKIKLLIRQLKELQNFYHRQHLRVQGVFQRDAYKKATANSISDDLDLVGPKSLFSLLDETLLLSSKQELLRLLLEGSSSKKAILQRQDRTKKWVVLAPQFLKWMIRTLALVPDQKSGDIHRTHTFEAILKSTVPLTGPDFFKMGLWTCYFCLIIYLLLFFILPIPVLFQILPLIWIMFLFLSAYSLKYSARAFFYAQNLETHLPFQKAYFHGMYKIAKSNDLSPLSDSLLKHNPQKHFQKISKSVSYLSLQSHPILFGLVNAFFPWNHFFASRLEKDISNLNQIYDDLKVSMVEIELQLSLIFFYLFQAKTFPTFSKEVCLNMENGYHPLIKRHQIKKNSIGISNQKPVVLITGSNMSGKTTFLRIIGINQMLALMGASVFADSFQTFLGKTHSCIRISDSVQRGDSYFYTEVLRMKDLLSNVKKKPCLFLIDEIFKGTNSRERLIGSQALIQALCQSKGLGLITTHDIELTKNIKGLENWHFTDHTASDHLVFDYEIKKGPAKTTNALKIMKSVGLPINIKQK